LSKTDESLHRDVLLSYLDLPIFQVVLKSIEEKSRTYANVKDFLIKRYSVTDDYIDRLSFFNTKYNGPPEQFASTLNCLFDLFSSKDLKEQMLVARFISATNGKLYEELRLRRPTSLSECVQIANSVAVPTPYACSISKPQLSNTEAFLQVVCFCCGRPGHKAKDKRCPARSAVCRNCSKPGHFASVCKSPKSDFNTFDDRQIKVDTIFVADAHVKTLPDPLQNRVSRPWISVNIANIPQKMDFLVDTGSEISVITRSLYESHLLQKYTLHELDNTQFRNFDDSHLRVDGWIKDVPISYNNKTGRANFFVASVPSSVIGMDIIYSLRLNLTWPEKSFVSTVSSGIKAAMITLKEDAPSTLRVPPRRLPFSLEAPVENEIRRLSQEGMIEPIDNSPYLSPIVVVPKPNNQVRLCVDYRQINKYIQTDQHYMPTSDEIFSKLHGANIFSRLDLKDAFHQVPLLPECRDITAFVTPLGNFRFTTLPFGLACSPAIFTRTLQRVIHSIPNVLSYYDDLLIFGETLQEHDKTYHRVMEALVQSGLKINEEKSAIRQTQLTFLGRQISNGKIKIPQEAVDAINKCPTPTDKTQLRSFLGLAGFYRNYVPSYSEKIEPLQALLEQATFKWNDNAQKAFINLKSAITSSLPLAFFDLDVRTETILTTDASSCGIGGVLTQVRNGIEKPVYFVSRKLRPTEKKFSSSELETLAALWCVERLHQFLYGRHFEIRTDHCALREVLLGKSSSGSSAPARISRWAARLMPYSFSVKYIRGSSNEVADGLSRLPLDLTDDNSYVDFSVLAIHGEPTCVTSQVLSSESLQDEILQQVSDIVTNDKWPARERDLSPDLRPYFRVRHELAVLDSLLLRGDRIVPPDSLRSQLLDFAHEGHFGIGKTKGRLRMSYWWPTMDLQVEQMVKKCHCCEHLPVRDSPVQEVQWPTTPWTHLAVDIAGPKHDKNGVSFYVVAVIDLHSKFVQLRLTKSITSDDVISFLRQVFRQFGYCLKLTSDNGVQFVSAQFVNFLREHGIIHLRAAVYNPQANGCIERFNRNLKKVIQACNKENLSLSQISERLDTYVFNYNNTPHSTTDHTPSQLLFKFRPRTRLEVAMKQSDPEEDSLKETVQAKIKKRAEYANSRRCPEFRCRFRVGDWVQAPKGPVRRLVKQVGDYTYRTDDNYTVNARRLRLVHRPQESVDIPSENRRYPLRERRPPIRFPCDRGKL
jgi:transposase InsO family protein